MTSLFPSRPGVVGVLYNQDVLPIRISWASTDGLLSFTDSQVMKAIMTSFDLGEESSVSVTHSLRQKIHIAAVGGVRAGNLSISGMWFGNVCNGHQLNSLTGMDALMQLHEGVRFGTTGRLVNVVISNTIALTAIVVSFAARIQDAALGIGEFTFQLRYMPRNMIGPVTGWNRALTPQQLLLNQAPLAGASL